MIETLDALGDFALRRPWHSVGVVIALNVVAVALWIGFEKKRDRNARGGAARPSDEPGRDRE